MQANAEICTNCSERIGRLESAHLWEQNGVCFRCYEKLSSISKATKALHAATEKPEYRALGLNSRSMALFVFVIGLVFSPLLIGIPLIVWGAVADYMIHKQEKQFDPPKNNLQVMNSIAKPVVKLPSDHPKVKSLNFPEEPRA